MKPEDYKRVAENTLGADGYRLYNEAVDAAQAFAKKYGAGRFPRHERFCVHGGRVAPTARGVVFPKSMPRELAAHDP